MRAIGAIVVILISIVSAGFWINHALQTTTDNLVRQIDRVDAEIKASHWQSAQEQTDILERDWNEEAKWWPVFLDHQEMDNIEFSMAVVKAYVASRNYALALGQLSEIRLMFEHIPKKEAVNLENIL